MVTFNGACFIVAKEGFSAFGSLNGLQNKKNASAS